VTRGESKALSFENQVVSTSINKRQKRHIKPIDLNSTQSSALRPQSSNLSPHNFEQVCAELLGEGHQVKFRAPGDSMYPTICNGDLITVKPIKPSNIYVGDIILYRHENGVVAHRVINIKAPIKKPSQNLNYSSERSLSLTQPSALSPQHCLTLRGDAAIYYDDPVEAKQILGKVVSVERNGRSIDPYGFRSKLYFKARRFASRLKRFLLNHQSTST
jgi:signal peptidase I